jgi:conjugal transfer pilus assembly protein TraW
MTFILISSFCEIVHANDLGVVGQIYSIAEEDFLNYIQNKVSAMKKNGEWSKLQKRYQTIVREKSERPTPVKMISKATVNRSWKYDPSIVVPFDLKDLKGRVFAKQGTKFNPLSMVTLKSVLLFIDSDDKSQVEWAENINKDYQGKTKIILINGSIKDEAKRFKKPIYFDQEGRLTTRFHIEHVPAIVTQQNDLLKVSEVVLP